MKWYKSEIGRDFYDCEGCIYFENSRYCTYFAEKIEDCDRNCKAKVIK
jgi:hypothetical protein